MTWGIFFRGVYNRPLLSSAYSFSLSFILHPLLQVLDQPSDQYKAFYGLPALPEVLSWDPDADLLVAERQPGHFFFVQPSKIPGVSMGDESLGVGESVMELDAHTPHLQPFLSLSKVFCSTCSDSDGTYTGYLTMPMGRFDSIHTFEEMQSIVRQAGPLLPDAW